MSIPVRASRTKPDLSFVGADLDGRRSVPL